MFKTQCFYHYTWSSVQHMQQNGKKWAGSAPLLINKTYNLLKSTVTHILQYVIFLNEKYGNFAGSGWWAASDRRIYLILTKMLPVPTADTLKSPQVTLQGGRFFLGQVWNHCMVCSFCLLKVSISSIVWLFPFTPHAGDRQFIRDVSLPAFNSSVTWAIDQE